MKERIEQASILAIAGLSILVSLLDFLGALDSLPWLANKIHGITLLVVALVAGYLVLERRNKLDILDDLIRDGTERTIRSLNGVDVKQFANYGELLDYVVGRIKQAKNGVDDLTWGLDSVPLERTISERQLHSKYRSAIIAACKREVVYREIMTFHTLLSLETAEAILEKNLVSYNLRYYDFRGGQVPPLLTFILIDSEELVIASYRRPHLPFEGEIRLAIKHPDIVRLFQDYYDTIWHAAQIIKEADHTNMNLLRDAREQLR